MSRLDLALVGRRRGFTLVEMLVVLALILVLTALAIAFVPKMNERAKVPRATSQVQMWLLIARQWAKRDNVPTGIRLNAGNLYPNPATPNVNFVTTLNYIQQPPPYHAVNTVNSFDSQILAYETIPPNKPPTGLSPTPTSNANLLKLQINSSTGFVPLDLFGGNALNGQATWLVQPGDYLETPTGGAIFTIMGVGADANNVPANPLVGDVLQLTTQAPTLSSTGTTDYRIIRGPRVLPGEQALLLTQDTAIDVTTNVLFGSSLPVNPFTSNIDIVFAPSGEVISNGLSSDKIMLWVRDVTQDGSVTQGAGMSGIPSGDQSLVVVYVRTGFIAAHAVYTGVNTLATSSVTPGMPGANVPITVLNPSGISVGDFLIIDQQSAANDAAVPRIFQETQQVVGVSGSTVTFGQMMSTHNSGCRVISDPYSYVRNAKSSGM